MDKTRKVKIGYVIKGYYAFPLIFGIVGLLVSIGLFFVNVKAGAISAAAYVVVLAVSLSTGAILIFLKQKKGLHTKKEDHGVFIYSCSHRL